MFLQGEGFWRCGWRRCGGSGVFCIYNGLRYREGCVVCGGGFIIRGYIIGYKKTLYNFLKTSFLLEVDLGYVFVV